MTTVDPGNAGALATDGPSDFRWDGIEDPHCPLCGSPGEDHRTFGWAQDELGQFRYVICTRCGLVFQSPAPEEEVLAAYYAGSYHQQMLAEREDDRRNEWVQRKRAAHVIQFLDVHIEQVARHLDVGCSRGTLLEASAARFGCAVAGIEPGNRHRGLAVGKGLEVVAELSQLPSDHERSFDLISLSHVLEHLQDPVVYLRALKDQWLTEGGHLLVEVPSLYWHRALERSHLTAFLPATLKGFLSVAGFEPVAERRHGQPYSRQFPLFIMALAQPSAAGYEFARLPSPPAMPRLRRRVSRWLFRGAQSLMDRLRDQRAMRPWHEG